MWEEAGWETKLRAQNLHLLLLVVALGLCDAITQLFAPLLNLVTLCAIVDQQPAPARETSARCFETTRHLMKRVRDSAFRIKRGKPVWVDRIPYWSSYERQVAPSLWKEHAQCRVLGLLDFLDLTNTDSVIQLLSSLISCCNTHQRVRGTQQVDECRPQGYVDHAEIFKVKVLQSGP